MMYSNKLVMCVLVDGKPIKELANGEVHIPFNKEYILRFRNKNDRRVVVKFWIDGELCSDEGGYVIPANDHIDIKRHNKCDRAFVLVPLDSGEAVDAGKNGPNYDKQKGVVKAEFTLEKKPEKVVYRDIHHHHDHYYPRPVPMPYLPVYPPPYRPVYPLPHRPYEPIWVGGTSVTSGSCSMSHNDGMESCNVGLNMCGASPQSDDIATFERISTPPACKMSALVEDGCTVKGTATGQRFGTTWVDLEESSTTLQIFLRGFDEGNEFPARKPQEANPRRRVLVEDESDDLELENERLKKEIADAKKRKSLEEENERLRRELKQYTG